MRQWGKKLKMTQTDGTILFSWTGRILLKWPHYPRQSTHSVHSLSKYQWHFWYWNSPGQNTGVGSLSLLQEIFPNQGSNPGLPHCRQMLYQLSHKWSLYQNTNGIFHELGQLILNFVWKQKTQNSQTNLEKE